MYYEKYIKYKYKYLNLLHGGSMKTAKDYFIQNIIKDRKKIDICFDDLHLYTKESFEVREANKKIYKEFDLSNDKNKEKYIENLGKIFNKIYKLINESTNVDWIIKRYLDNKFAIPGGSPSSLKYYNNYVTAYSKYEILKNNGMPNIKPINDIVSLAELLSYVAENDDFLKIIDEKKRLQELKKQQQKEIERLGAGKKINLLDTSKLLVISPTTEEGSRYYGRNTKWCTTMMEGCLFNNYAKDGLLYIIQSKTISMDKYQLQINKSTRKVELKNSANKSIYIDDLIEHFQDPKFNTWLDDLLKKENAITYSIDDTEYSDSKKITVSSVICILDLLRKLSEFENIEILVFLGFDTIISSSLLKTLFDSLVTLKELIFIDFNQMLGDSLSSLVNLENLFFGNFNQILGNSLSSLENLKTLSFIDFNHPLDDSLVSLVKLENLSLKYFNHQFYDSLSSLENLKTLKIGDGFEQKLNGDLSHLVNLETLSLNYKYTLNGSLTNLHNLKDLYLKNFNQPLNDSLQSLVRLETLDLGDDFNQMLGDSLKNLVGLVSLRLGKKYDISNKPIKESLKSLPKLLSVKIGTIEYLK